MDARPQPLVWLQKTDVARHERPRAQATLVRSRSDYRLVFRLFEHLWNPDLASAQALVALLRQTIPIARLAPATHS